MSIFDKCVSSVKNQINQKLDYGQPYYARKNTVRNMVTDMDEFPYNKYFRGQYNSEAPIVFDREAGWRLRNDRCYQGLVGYAEPLYPNHCFEAPCSTVYPCQPKYSKDQGDSAAINVWLNKNCVPKSP
jgi:hypothetical protein